MLSSIIIGIVVKLCVIYITLRLLMDGVLPVKQAVFVSH